MASFMNLKHEDTIIDFSAMENVSMSTKFDIIFLALFQRSSDEESLLHSATYMEQSLLYLR
jgi:hypothetical protein